MRYRVFLDCFTSLDDLKPKEKRDPEAVLAVLRHTKRFSAFDMADRAICGTICDLETAGRIKTDNSPGFPWINVEVVS